jgi:hypothetical protein
MVAAAVLWVVVDEEIVVWDVGGCTMDGFANFVLLAS